VLADGVTVDALDYVVWPDNLTVWRTNSATGTSDGTFTPGTGVAGGVTGTMSQVVIDIDARYRQSVTVDFALDEDLELSADQNIYGNITLTDTGVVLTAARNVIVSAYPRDIIVTNNTGQDLTVKTAAGSGFVVPSGFSLALRVDGTDVVISKLMSAGQFSDQDMSPTGHKVIPSGDESVPDTIIQWGEGIFPNGETNVSLPVPYPTAHLQAFACNGGASVVGADFGAAPNGLTSISVYCESATDRTARWFSVGN